VNGSRRTRTICERDLRFTKASKILDHADPNLPFADAVSITFRFQKNDERNSVVTMYATGDPLLCPVRAWAAIITSLLQLPKCSDTVTVNTMFSQSRRPTPDNPGVFQSLTGIQRTALIRRAVTHLGFARLGVHPSECGTHSIRSGAAMAMHLSNVPAYTIMLIGRWSSDAFLVYLRPQVLQFTRQVSSRMIEHSDFFSMPDHTKSAPSTDPNQISRRAPLVPINPSSGTGTRPHQHQRLIPSTPFNIHT